MPKITENLKSKIRESAQNRCGYCLAHQKYTYGKLEIEHLQPRAKGGTHEESNLWLVCRDCNGHKATRTHGLDEVSGEVVSLFNPRIQQWNEHFEWDEEGTHILGITLQGRIVTLLQLNRTDAVKIRQL